MIQLRMNIFVLTALNLCFQKIAEAQIKNMMKFTFPANKFRKTDETINCIILSKCTRQLHTVKKDKSNNLES